MEVGKVTAVTITLITLLVWISLLQGEFFFWKVTGGSLLLLGPTIYSLLPEVFLAHEFWAGALISLSLVTYARGCRIVSIASGLIALFLRELTLPFICVMLVLSYTEGHRREALAWILGIVVFAVIFSWHWIKVMSLVLPGDLSLNEGWIAFGGWPFVLSTAQMHPYLFSAPPWVTAFVLPLVLVGLAGWPGPLGLRVTSTVGVYILGYCFIGNPFNKYWGLMYMNVLPLGLLYTSHSLRDLWGSARINNGEG